MPTREFVEQLAATSSDAKGEGPLQSATAEAPQSLVTKHECLAARPNAQPCPHSCHDGRLQPGEDRVRSTGARTPCSLAAEIEAQVAATTARKESEAKQGEEGQNDTKMAAVEKK
ncbi:hypothetical protein FALBO_7837 [Fusarium albosuccineum]|uniref:Uncharacterized protein n=1 Tax=Fusarium albosuccineum TaxID=1237068 RepID=A0A8H4L928_9HYPO|nr:hypothetical protein FALBO_7837 [Fusarium albosuccineum]